VKARASLNKNTTPFTPGVPLVLALEEAIRLIEEEGISAVQARHTRHAAACRAAVSALGLELYAEVPSNGLTAVRAPEGKDGQELVAAMLKQHGMRIAGGQEPMKGKLIRLGHMGYYSDADIVDLIGAWETTCRDLGWTDRSGARATAENVLNGLVPQTSEEGMALRAQSDQSAA